MKNRLNTNHLCATFTLLLLLATALKHVSLAGWHARTLEGRSLTTHTHSSLAVSKRSWRPSVTHSSRLYWTLKRFWMKHHSLTLPLPASSLSPSPWQLGGADDAPPLSSIFTRLPWRRPRRALKRRKVRGGGRTLLILLFCFQLIYFLSLPRGVA